MEERGGLKVRNIPIDSQVCVASWFSAPKVKTVKKKEFDIVQNQKNVKVTLY